MAERALKASSNGGDIVFDPFRRCGTALQVAQSRSAAGLASIGFDERIFLARREAS